MQPASLDDPLYYLRNAEQVVSWCLQIYADLFDEKELALLGAWERLEDQPKALLIRLVMRKGTVFRLDKLSYQEIPQLEAALANLAKHELVEVDPSISALQLAEALLRQELWQWLSISVPEQGLPKQSKKADLLAIAGSIGGDKPITQWWPDSQVRLITLSCNGLFECLRLLFFGNLHQDWSEFVLTELGYQQYEKVHIASDQRAFQRQAEINFYMRLHELAGCLEEGQSAMQLLPQVPADSDVPWLQEKLQKLLFSLGHNAERDGHFDLALELYQRSATNDAMVRCVRVMEKYLSTEATWQQCHDYLRLVEQPVIRLLIQRVAKRCAKKLDLSFKIKQPSKPLEQSLTLLYAENISVEQAVINYYQSEYKLAFHVENDLFTSLFGLLFWPAIYAPVPGAFFHPFQTRPKDLYSPLFASQRQTLIDTAFVSLEDGSYREQIAQRWQAKQGVNNRFMNWSLLNESLLNLALDLIPACHLQLIFKHMLSDLQHHCSGMPDLVVFNPQAQTYELVEVKGPGDRLQEHQKFWLDFYQRNNIPAKVIYVEWQT